jgi:putative aminopeptidase FrvX
VTEVTALETLAELIRIPAPPGEEQALAAVLRTHLAAHTKNAVVTTDAKGNVLVAASPAALTSATTLITAHLDEIALMVTQIRADGTVFVAPLGGAHPWKWGEGPVTLLGQYKHITGILSLGSIHTNHPASTIQRAREGHVPTWSDVFVLTGCTHAELTAAGIRVGTRVVIAESRRTITELNHSLIAAYFLDDRAPLLAWLNAITQTITENLDQNNDWIFLASVAEEVGGEGALYASFSRQFHRVIALEIGPSTTDDPFPITDQPTVWVSDGYSATPITELDRIALAATDSGLTPRFQVLTRGGSDGSIAQAHGYCAAGITLALPTQNSHGYEIIHQNGIANLTKLLLAYLNRLD